jgi:hypothetical protein
LRLAHITRLNCSIVKAERGAETGFFTLRHQHHDETFRSFESPTNRASSTASVRVTEDCHADGLRCALNAAQLSEEKQQLNVAELATGKQATDEG